MFSHDVHCTLVSAKLQMSSFEFLLLFCCVCVCVCFETFYEINWCINLYFCFWSKAFATFSVNFLFHFRFGIQMMGRPVWFFWSANISYQWWRPSRNNTITSAWVRFDYRSYCYIIFDHKETMPLCTIYVI